MKIIISNDSSIKIDNNLIKKIVEILFQKEKVNTDEVHINFVKKNKIKNLHLKFFNDNSLTDCITCPIDHPLEKTNYHILGEVFICPSVAIDFAKKHKLDAKNEIALYVIHSLLHLIGYDDINKNDVRLMRRKEFFFLNLFKKMDLLS